MSPDIRAGIRRVFRLSIRDDVLAHAELDEGLAFHLEARTAQFIALGMPPDEARAEAVRRMGSTSRSDHDTLHRTIQRKEAAMAMRERWSELRQDMMYAWRSLRQRPTFTTIAVLTLAIGIGANTAIFSAIDALLLRELPFPEPQALMTVSQTGPADGPEKVSPAPWSYRKYTVFKEAQRSYSVTALYAESQVLITGDDPERIRGELMSEGYFTALGAIPARGRDFSAEEVAGPGGPKRVVISDHLWRARYQANPEVIGMTIPVNGQPFEIIGVMSPAFRGLSGRAELWLPIVAMRDADDLASVWSLEYSLIARLRPGVTLAAAQSDARQAAHRVWTETTSNTTTTVSSGGAGEWSAIVESLDATRTSPGVKRSLLVLFGAVGFVLLMACVNLVNLLLGRAAARRQEIAIRLAIGAGRGRIIRLLLIESLMIACCGGIGGLLVATWGTHLLARLNPQETLQAQNLSALGASGFSTIHLDLRALAFSAVVTLIVGLLVGLFPALHASRQSLQHALKRGGPARGRIAFSRRTLVISEVALALILLAGAGLTMRSLSRLMAVDAGFEPDNLLTLRLAIPPGEQPRDSLPGFYDGLLAQLSAIPGVTLAGTADCPPLAGGCNGTIITFPDRPPAPEGHNAMIGVHFVSPGWFEALKIPVQRGRGFTSSDRLGASKVVLVSEAAAKKYWPGEDPVGKPVAIWQGGFHTGATVIGVVGDVRFGTIDSLPQPDSYISLAQAPRALNMIFLRTAIPPTSLIASVRGVVHDYAPSYPVYDIATMNDRVAVATSQARFVATLLGLFAGIALSLAILGIYGVMAFAVMQRTREIGIRIALGAEPARVLGSIVGEGMRLALIGAATGLVAAFLLTRVLRGMLFDIEPSDPVTYLAIIVILILATVFADWLPARQAAKVNPTEALRRG